MIMMTMSRQEKLSNLYVLLLCSIFEFRWCVRVNNRGFIRLRASNLLSMISVEVRSRRETHRFIDDEVLVVVVLNKSGDQTGGSISGFLDNRVI